jgi:hypothetical protein
MLAVLVSLLDECRPEWHESMEASLVQILDRLEAYHCHVEAGSLMFSIVDGIVAFGSWQQVGRGRVQDKPLESAGLVVAHLSTTLRDQGYHTPIRLPAYV